MLDRFECLSFHQVVRKSPRFLSRSPRKMRPRDRLGDNQDSRVSKISDSSLSWTSRFGDAIPIWQRIELITDFAECDFPPIDREAGKNKLSCDTFFLSRKRNFFPPNRLDLRARQRISRLEARNSLRFSFIAFDHFPSSPPLSIPENDERFLIGFSPDFRATLGLEKILLGDFFAIDLSSAEDSFTKKSYVNVQRFKWRMEWK